MKSKASFPAARSIRQGVLKAWTVCRDLRYGRTSLGLGIMLCIGTASILWHLTQLSSQLVESTALDNARLYTVTLAEFRTLYTSEVVARVRDHGVEVTHDYSTKDGAIPLPATLSMLLGKSIGQHYSGVQTRLYSAYPFPWRQKTGGLQDEFAKMAWDQLRQNPTEPVYRFESFDGRPSLRYATADLMRSACVNCHNTHPDTPKNDWEVGDVRGVLEIVHPMDTIVERTEAGLRGTFAMMFIMTGLGLAGLALVIGKLRRNQAELERRVLERTAELQTSNKELEGFAYSVSHNLRSPLRIMDGFSQLLLEDYADKFDAEGKDILNRVRASSQRMGQLIDDLLNLSSVMRSEMSREPVDLSALAETVADELRVGQPERQVEFVIEEEQIARGDRRLLELMLQNMVGNAWKFTEKQEHAKIEFGRTPVDGESVYFVRDNGAGFDMDYAEKLFAPFQRLHSVGKFAGTGVGLAIVQRIINRHGGRVWAEGAVEQGATFYFTLEPT